MWKINALNKTNFERSICLEDFCNFASKISNLKDLRIGVVGSKNNPDPEIDILVHLGVDLKDIFYIGIGGEVDYKIDFDTEFWAFPVTFDILIISNVVEHLWNLGNAFDNFVKMTKSGSFIYIIGPTYNFYHLSPNFYSSGYDYNFFKLNLELRNFVELFSRRIGTKRLYFMQHNLRSWPSVRAHNYPLLYAFDEVNFPLRYFLFFKNLFFLLIAQFKSRKLIADPAYCSGMLIILRRL